jgi:hypothetical protein
MNRKQLLALPVVLALPKPAPKKRVPVMEVWTNDPPTRRIYVKVTGVWKEAHEQA